MEGRKGKGERKERAMSPPHYLEEVYAYGAPPPTSKSWLRHWNTSHENETKRYQLIPNIKIFAINTYSK